MDRSMQAISGLEVGGLSVLLLRDLRVASLRYFDATGPFAGDVRRVLGGPLPEPLRALKYSPEGSRAELILAWRSPTEILLVTTDAALFAAILNGVASDAAEGCVVDQTGGLLVWRVTGERTRDLLLRVGSAASLPALGEATMSRVAELPVTALCVRTGEILLLVERVYSDHLLGWIGATAADF